MEIAERLPLNPVDFMVLVVLLPGESYGYRMVKEIRERSAGRIDLLPGNLYSVLQRMEKSGLIERSERRVPGEGGQPRSYYSITELGRAVAAAEVERLSNLVAASELQELVKEHSR